MTIKSELLSIQHATTDNILHVSDVVEWARENPGSLLHRSLEWNDEKAANEYRFDQARRLIAIHVVADDGAPLVVSLTIDRKAGGGYRDLNDVGARPDLRQIMLNDALAELERVRTKYERVRELAAVWEETDRVAAQVPQRTRGRRATATA